MKTNKKLCLLLAFLMLAALCLPAAARAPEERSEELAIVPCAGDGVTLEYDESAFTLRVTPMYGLLRIEENKVLTLAARFGSGWSYNGTYSNFFRDHAGRVTVTDGEDGEKIFSFSAVRGELLTRDELLTVGIYATPESLPKLEINASVPFSQIGKEEWVTASFALTLGTKQFAGGDYSGTGSIKGRGNTSWGQPKKPYSIKLDSKASLLGIPKTKKYAIVPSYSDDSMLRNMMTYKACLSLLGIDYTPKCEFVEVYLNGSYNGIYILVERVAIESNKIDIEEATAEELTGGYLIEKDVDNKIDFDSDQWFNCPYWANQGHDYFVLKTPEPEDSAVLSQMLSYLTGYMRSLHNAVTGASAEPWTKYVDVDSWVDFIIVQELAKNIDGNLKTSCYMVKKAQDDKLYLTAPWDFDLAYGNPACTWDNADYSHNDYYDCPDALGTADFMTINSSCPWFDHLYDDQAAFREALTERYAEYRGTMIPEMLRLIDSQAAYISGAVPRDEAKWGVRFSAGVTQLRGWFTGRLEWLDSVWLADSEPIDLDFALNAEGGNRHFETSGAYPFAGTIKDGRVAGVSGNAGKNSSESTVSLTLEMKAGETLSFDYKVSSESGYDLFTFSVNGQQKLSKSGEVEWNSHTFTASSDGTFTFLWKFEKDYSVAGGSDCAWLDNVKWSGEPAALLGDVDGNGVVDSADALLLLRYVMGLSGSLPCPQNADVNGDGVIDSSDAIAILRSVM